MIHEVIMYAANCDRCGVSANFGDFVAYSDRGSVMSDIDEQGWIIYPNDVCLCDKCSIPYNNSNENFTLIQISL